MLFLFFVMSDLFTQKGTVVIYPKEVISADTSSAYIPVYLAHPGTSCLTLFLLHPSTSNVLEVQTARREDSSAFLCLTESASHILEGELVLCSKIDLTLLLQPHLPRDCFVSIENWQRSLVERNPDWGVLFQNIPIISAFANATDENPLGFFRFSQSKFLHFLSAKYTAVLKATESLYFKEGSRESFILEVLLSYLGDSEISTILQKNLQVDLLPTIKPKEPRDPTIEKRLSLSVPSATKKIKIDKIPDGCQKISSFFVKKGD